MSRESQQRLIGGAALLRRPSAALVTVAMVAAALACAPAARADMSFAAPVPYPVGSQPMTAAVGDFDRNGNLDLAVANGGSDTVSVLPGGSRGVFGAQTAYPAGRGPGSVVTADFNRDGDLDLAVADRGSNSVSVLLGGAGTTFGPATAYPAGTDPWSAAVGDFNGDGNPDLAVANADWGTPSGSVSVLLGRNDGSFRPQTTYLSGRLSDAVVVGDFNRDGHPDLAIGLYGGAVSVLLGRGDGSFGSPTDYAVDGVPYSVAAGDFNRDGYADLAVADYSGNSVAILLGKPGGTFAASRSYPANGVADVSIVVADFDGDGQPDLALPTWSATVSLLPGSPDGSFGAPVQFPTGGANGWRWAAVGDFDRDGAPDLAIVNPWPSNDVTVLLNRKVVLDPDPVAFATTVAGEVSPSRTVTLTNHGQAPVAVSHVALTGDDADGFATSADTCAGTTVSPGGSCTVGVRFAPTRVGAHAARLEVTDDALHSPHSAALSGTGISAGRLSPNSVAFQARPDHTTSTSTTVTLTNFGNAALSVGGVTVTGTDASSFLAGNDACTGHTLATGTSCTVRVSFRPLGTGVKTAALRFDDDAIGSPQTVALSGTGTPGAWLQLSVQALKFGHARVGTTAATKSVTLTNVGSAGMRVTAIAVDGTNAGDFPGLTESCLGLSNLAPGQSCAAGTAFAPTATGTRTATLTITDTAPRSPHRLTLNGTGT